MNLSAVLSALRHLPQAEKLVAAGEALAASPLTVAFDAALAEYEAAVGVKASAAATPVAQSEESQPAAVSGHPSGSDRGEI